MNSERSISNLVAIGIVIVILASAVIGVYYFAYMAPGNSNGRSGNSALILYSADAYVAEATALESAFTANSGTLMAPPKSGGSLLLAQEIAQGNPVSIFLSVAKSAVSPVTLGSASSGWAVSFASDQMTIAYSNITIQDNAASGVINSYLEALQTNSTQDWHNFFLNLTSGDVKVGISNPNVDPAGYRAWIVLESAGMTYANGNSSYFVDRMLSNQGNVTSASAADLIAPLQSGNIQFLFIYKSAAIAQKLNLIQLANPVNLGDPAHQMYYSQFIYTISSGIQKGGVIALFLAVPSTSTNTADSLSFVSYVIKNGPPILQQFGLESISPGVLYNDSAVPSAIEQLLSGGFLTLGGAL